MQYAKPKVYWLMLIGVIFSILNTSTSYADVTCPAGMIADTFQATDYASLAPNTNPATPTKNQSIVGVKDESYLVVSNYLTTTGEIKGKDYYRPTTISGQTAFEFFQDFQTPISTRTITYDFTNRFTGTAQPVEKFSLTVYDIDSNYVGGQTGYIEYEYVDELKIEGKTASGTTVTPTVTSKGTNITATSPFSQTARRADVVCDNTIMDDKCKVAITFSQPVVQVAVTYGNVAGLDYYDIGDDNNDRIRIGDPGDQVVNIVFDGYCYTPQPRLSLTKLLASNRIVNTDQFNVQVKDTSNNTVVSPTTNSTTSGSTNVVTTGTGTTGTFKVDPTKTYQLTEIAAGTTDLTKYAATYSCKKADGTTVTTLNPNSLNLTYGDNWTCTVTNSRVYTFSGIVFNDNGGLTLANDLSVPVGTNTTYFNGVYDSSVEKGITQAGLTIDLAKNCNATTPTIIQSAIVGSDGTYSISATSTQMANATNVCLIQREPNGNLTSYPVDTTNNQANITFASTTYDYQNINFGEVSQNNAGLVLVKEQAVNDCTITNTGMLALSYNINSTNQLNTDARKCVAYKITAYNRTNLTKSLTNVRITDALPKKGVNNSTVTSALVGPTDATSNNFNINFTSGVTGAVTALGQNGTVVSNVKLLDKGASIPLYFNTKYDSSLP
ncbi:MAG TPA: hypothetical protein DDY26_09895 [Moraxellaceae bacterium]|nr:hypothetical protein [Moraxella sp.]HBI50100.1 hypothetical protein [Moraxellaceae bacterium]